MGVLSFGGGECPECGLCRWAIRFVARFGPQAAWKSPGVSWMVRYTERAAFVPNAQATEALLLTALQEVSEMEQKTVRYHPGRIEEYDSAHGNSDRAWYSCCGALLSCTGMGTAQYQQLSDRPPPGCRLQVTATAAQQATYEAALARLETLMDEARCLRCEQPGHVERHCSLRQCCCCGRYGHLADSCHFALLHHEKDWRCLQCGRINFSSRLFCAVCKAAAPAAPPPASVATVLKPGDWCCLCGVHNFASRKICYRCGEAFGAARAPALQAARSAAQLPRQVAASAHAEPLSASKAGDWTCEGCGICNFARRHQCFKCGSVRATLT